MIRIIPRLDIKWPNLIKGIQLEGLRVIGNPQAFTANYYATGADEIILMDCVASLYNRNSLNDLIRQVAESVFVPITVGGGIRSVDNAKSIFRSGADKVAINTAAIASPDLIKDIAYNFGSQAVVLSVEAKKYDHHKWLCYYDNGRENSGLDVIDWVKKAEDLGAGEILLTSVDNEGTEIGFDYELIEKVSHSVNVPVIASGGMGTLEHCHQAVTAGASAVAIAKVLHYNELTIPQIKKYLTEKDLKVRV